MATQDTTIPVQFAPEPPLWPESFTDCYRINLNADNIDVEETIDMVTEEDLALETYYDDKFRILYTSNQEIADRVKEQLYGREVAFAHTHIPRSTISEELSQLDEDLEPIEFDYA